MISVYQMDSTEKTCRSFTSIRFPPEVGSFFVVSVRAAFHGIRIQSAVDKDFDRGAVNVNIGTQFHAGRVLGRVENGRSGYWSSCRSRSCAGRKGVESGIRGMREFDRCLNAETVGIINTLSDGGWPHPKKEISRNEEAYTRIRPPLRER